MKTINLKNVSIEEVIVRPNDDTPISILYKTLDDTGVVVNIKRENIAKSDLTAPALTALTTLVTKLLTKIETKEL